jgi:hypothetical protein
MSRISLFPRSGILTGAVLLLLATAVAAVQFSPAEIAERSRWEDFLRTAAIVGAVQLGEEEAVTTPWKLTLQKDGVVRHALWKNVSGSPRGIVDNWLYEIAAYDLDKLLGLGMVPPTVPKRFRGMAGSCQLWIEEGAVLKKRLQEGLSSKVLDKPQWLRQAYIQQLFDNLIGNEDRHQGNVLITPDERSFLIDHSRTFRTTKTFKEILPFSEAKFPGEGVMRELPRALVEKVKALNEQAIREAVGKTLSGKEIGAVLARKELILKEIDRLIAEHGEAAVLY